MIDKLIGHTRFQTTSRDAHLARDIVNASAACIGDSIEGYLDTGWSSPRNMRSILFHCG